MIRERLDEARRNLLDLTRRNRLLNFRAEGRRVVRIIDELPSQVFRLLVEEGKTMQFVPLDDAPGMREIPSRGVGDDEQILTELFDLAAVEGDEGVAIRHTDLFLQTAHRAKQLQARLLAVSREAESVLQERGCNVLYLTMGMAHWSEPSRGSATSMAPLVLLPIELVRRSVKQRHAVRLLDEDPIVNPILAEFLRRQYRVELPELDMESPNPVQSFFEKLRKVIEPIDGWRLDELQMFVGLLSFAKLLMYLDLDVDRWPASRKIQQHPHVLSLMDLASPYPAAPEPLDPSTIDDEVAPDDSYQVLDADSSQQAAIIGAKRGASMVIQGPPGTGKSQTITNIIAECLAEGKTVLFVAEKAAALDVVKRRLEGVGLGSFVAELHSRKASKRGFMEDLARALESTPTIPRDGAGMDPDELARVRRQLNTYVRELHERVAPLGASVFDMIGRSAALSDAPEAVFFLDDVASWSGDGLRDALDVLTTYSRAATRAGSLDTHPFRGVQLESVSLAVRQRLLPVLAEAKDKTAQAMDAAETLAEALGAHAPQTSAHIDRLLAVAEAVLAAGSLDEGLLRSWEWTSLPPEAAGLLDTGRRVDRARAAARERWLESAEKGEWAGIAERHRRQRESVLRLLTPQWYRDQATIRQHLRPGVRLAGAELSMQLDQLAELNAAITELDQRRDVGLRLFGSLWKGDQSDWDALDALARALIEIKRLGADGLASPEGLLVLARPEATGRVQSARDAAAGAIHALRAHWATITSLLEIDNQAFFNGDPDATPLATWTERIEECMARHETLRDWIDQRQAQLRCREQGLGPFLDWPQRFDHPPDRWPGAFERQFCRLWLDWATQQRPALRGFRGEDHEATLERFRRLDQHWLRASRSRLAAQISQRRPRVGHAVSSVSGLGMLEAEIRKKRRIKPIRRLLASPAGEAVQRIKPCFMMSPISIAQYFEPGRFHFDVVIFDEASQVEPADAIGAIARADQIILVGDDKQLPPTNFFDAAIEDEPLDEDDTYTPAGDLESVLALGQAKLPRTRLRWHYRSRHESLIDFSNRQFYDGALRVFPSASRDRAELGVSLEHVPEGVYLRGSGRFNPVEATRVAQAVLAHAQHRGGLSLGVGAFSVQQQRAIEDEVERLRREADDPALEAWFEEEREEPFFVKNLETIQGDERDVMLLSVGYGPDERGRLTNHFGPVNRDGGWRRLNVLVTRARRQCRVFSSITGDRIDIDSSAPRGVQALRDYLRYASLGEPLERALGPRATRGANESPNASDFQAHLARALRDKGWELHEDVGCEGFSIDLAVVDPATPGRYLAGIECDGAVYRDCATARDRDRLRGLVLDRLGWNLVRVWAADWYHQPQTTIERLHDAFRRLRDEGAALPASPAAHTPHAPHAEGLPEPKPEPGAADTNVPIALDAQEDVLDTGPVPPGMVGYQRFQAPARGGRDELLQAPIEELVSLIHEIVDVEGPIHVEELSRVATDVYGSRAAGHAADRVHEALGLAISEGDVQRRGEFVWPRAMQRPPVRWRGAPGAVTSASLICEEEVVEAVLWAVEHDFGVPREDLGAAAMRALGYKRVGKQLQVLGERAARAALESGRVKVADSGLVELQ